jgi:hypothetical protein
MIIYIDDDQMKFILGVWGLFNIRKSMYFITNSQRSEVTINTEKSLKTYYFHGKKISENKE